MEQRGHTQKGKQECFLDLAGIKHLGNKRSRTHKPWTPQWSWGDLDLMWNWLRVVSQQSCEHLKMNRVILCSHLSCTWNLPWHHKKCKDFRKICVVLWGIHQASAWAKTTHFIHISKMLLIHSFIHPSIEPLTRPPVHLFINLSIYLSPIQCSITLSLSFITLWSPNW